MKKIAGVFFVWFWIGFGVSPTLAEAEAPSSPKKSSAKEIQVSLFGQPCQLTGPLEKAQLQALHAISPEQIPPGLTTEQLKKTLEKLKKPAGLPTALDLYRQRMQERLEAQIAFFEALEAAKKSGKGDSLLAGLQKYFKVPSGQKNFEALVKKLQEGKGTASVTAPSAWSSANVDELTEAYLSAIQPDPEEDFHRTIRKLGVQYHCSFDEGEGEGD